MKITWFGHSCFKIEKDDYSIVIDPYATGSVPGYLPVNTQANEILCSHEHGDHSGRSEVRCVQYEKASPFTIEVIDTYHDEVKGAKRGPNKIHIISDGIGKIAHLGDLGCTLERDRLEKLMHLDCVLIPVGGYYTIDGKQAAALIQTLNPKIAIPMHYRDDKKGIGYSEIDTVDTFASCAGSVTIIPASEIETEFELPTQVGVLQPLRVK